MYNEKTKASMMRYKKEKREEVRLNVPKGTLAKYKAFAETQGMSMTAYITALMEREMAAAGFEWHDAEQERIEQERTETVETIRAQMKPPAKK